MRHRKAKAAGVAALVLGGGLLFQSAAGCAQFGAQSTLGSVDFCFLFDCIDGAIGGLLQPCDNIGTINTGFDNRDTIGSAEDPGFGRLFNDCPDNVNP